MKIITEDLEHEKPVQKTDYKTCWQKGCQQFAKKQTNKNKKKKGKLNQEK